MYAANTEFEEPRGEKDPFDLTPEEVVARIKARGPDYLLGAPDPEAVRAFSERVRQERPMTREEYDEWYREWAPVMEEIRRLDRVAEVSDVPTSAT